VSTSSERRPLAGIGLAAVARPALARLPAIALLAFVVGLALHNLVMAELWELGLRGTALDVVAGWKDVFLLVALGLALAQTRRLPLETVADRLALAYAGIVVAYWLVPQSWLGGEATARGELLALRHHLIPVAAYALGRLIVATSRDRRRLVVVAAATAVAATVWGLVDIYLVPLQWWRESGVPGWYADQLGLTYEGLSGLPENWVYNTGDEDNPVRRLVTTFLSPLATAYVLVVVILVLAARRPTRWTVAAATVCYLGLLWTHTRAAYLALAGGFVLLAALKRSAWPAVAAAVTLVVSVGFVKAFPTIGPSTSYTSAELEYLRERGAKQPGVSEDPLAADESSVASHWRNLRDGVETVLRHPHGYGLGNAGVTAKRTGVELQAGESTYTELGVDAGLAGAAAFVAWCLALLAALRSSAGLAVAFAAVLALGLQSDVIGVHWLAYVLFAAAGAAVASSTARAGEHG
jgi:O-antigen ligase/polysaccharide polymerase Wzy-like membrane protein